MSAILKEYQSEDKYFSEKYLNLVLKDSLTEVNQYFLHARMLKNQGFMKLADSEYKKSIDVMKHSDMLVEHILSQGGLPDMQELGRLYIGKDALDILLCDIRLSELNIAELKAIVAQCEKNSDSLTLDILRKIAISKEEHIDFTRKQLELIDSIGIANYKKDQE